MSIKQIYKKFRIPPNLQKHQLRVAGMAKIISDNWKGAPIDKETIVTACLFHDMANIIKYDFTRTDWYKEDRNKIPHWKKVQQEMIEKYGPNIHQATLQIDREIGLPEKVLKIIDSLDWDNTIKVIESEDWPAMIAIYSDMRIGPFGILSLHDRIDDLRQRNKVHDFDSVVKTAEKLEKTLQDNVTINLNSITDKDLIFFVE